MRAIFFALLVVCVGFAAQAQNKEESNMVKGAVLNAATDKTMSDVNIVNLNQVIGTISDKDGNFKIRADVGDTLYFSYLGFKSIQIGVTEDWKKYGDVKIKMTEVGFALEEVTLEPMKLTGFLEIDAKNIPIYDDFRYRISGSNSGYEAGSSQPSGFSKTLSSIFNPVDFLHSIFGNKPRQMRKLRKMKEDDEIQRLLEKKFDRETLAILLHVSKDDINKILRHCNYSKSFIKEANDLQILDAISECYEHYRALNND